MKKLLTTKKDLYKGFEKAINNLKDGGDVYSGRVMLDKAKYNYIKEYNADWIPGVDFDRLEEQRKSGKPALYYQNGWIFEYKGYQTDGAIFEVKLH